MNRRGFLDTLLKAGVGFSILPAATTYARLWKAERLPVIPVISNTWRKYDPIDVVYDREMARIMTGYFVEYYRTKYLQEFKSADVEAAFRSA